MTPRFIHVYKALDPPLEHLCADPSEFGRMHMDTLIVTMVDSLWLHKFKINFRLMHPRDMKWAVSEIVIVQHHDCDRRHAVPLIAPYCSLMNIHPCISYCLFVFEIIFILRFFSVSCLPPEKTPMVSSVSAFYVTFWST